MADYIVLLCDESQTIQILLIQLTTNIRRRDNNSGWCHRLEKPACLAWICRPSDLHIVTFIDAETGRKKPKRQDAIPGVLEINVCTTTNKENSMGYPSIKATKHNALDKMIKPLVTHSLPTIRTIASIKSSNSEINLMTLLVSGRVPECKLSSVPSETSGPGGLELPQTAVLAGFNRTLPQLSDSDA
ncbi:hypothetical protein MS3_00006473 [Schistosoma haematobium]|uniref:Uncharacterized protein n=1 Tax=Schistosoma haematobium TaxID=6185 RepID=A0A6A5D3E5_SCHHA|nr:hypothetical protein MS3_00006473 [Schistosoma haematobium]KAH9585115.1 hypothetical protein MS3_00006473 [Schistosoma haematobium]